MAVDVQAIIAKVMADPKVQQSMRLGEGHFATHVYEDEPILKTGRQMLDERRASVLPPAYRKARDLEYGPDTWRWPDARLFYEEALLLADVEDDRPYLGSFEHYYPSYRIMSDLQLRGYVTWRTHVRAGWVEDAPASFAFVYVYELLMGVGAPGGPEGYRTLRDFWERYRAALPDLNRYLRGWLLDYAVWWGVDPGLVVADPAFSADFARDAALNVVLHPEGRSEEERWAAFVRLSGYAVERSRFYKDYPEDVRRVLSAVVADLESYYRKNRAKGLFETFFGSTLPLPRDLFSSALFYQPARHADCVYELGPLRRYRCSGGLWTCERPYGGKGEGRALGSIVKLVDARMRERYGYAHGLTVQGGPKYLNGIIDKNIDAWLREKEARAARQITIDRSKLGGIRTSAAATCDALLVDEERGFGPGGDVRAGVPAGGAAPMGIGLAAGASAVPAVPAARSVTPAETSVAPPASGASGPAGVPASRAVTAPAAVAVGAYGVLAVAAPPAPPGPCGLTGPEIALLRHVLAGEPCADAAPPAGGTIEMLVDAVNEKLYDLLGDTALEFDGGAPVLIEDYREDVEGIL